MKIIVNGANGAMGRELCRLAREHYLDSQLAAAVSRSGGEGICASWDEVTLPADVIVDFSHHAAMLDMLAYARKRKIPVVVATTGFNEKEKAFLRSVSEQIPIFYSANMSVGVALLCRLAKQAAQAFPDADLEIVEIHHNRKLDAPSGTALMLGDALREVRPDATFVCGRSGSHLRTKQEIGIQSVRMGNIVGIHEVHICTNTQTITLKHEAHSRSLFAEGALVAAEFLTHQQSGLYNMQDLLASNAK